MQNKQQFLKIKKQKKNSAKSLSRLATVLALYQMDIARTDLNIIIDEFINSRGPSVFSSDNEDSMQIDISTMNINLFKNILYGVIKSQKEIDQKIHEKLTKNWPMSRINVTLRAIFRASGYELIKRIDIPRKVIINEYVDLSKAFFDSRETNMINGVLNNIAKDIPIL